MNRTPWQLWDTKSGQPAAGADTAEAIAVLERSLAQAGRHAASGSAAHVCSSHGDVAVSAARAARRRCAAHRRSRCRPSRAHADPHRCAVRPLQECMRLERPRHRRRRQISEAAGAEEFLFALSLPQLSLQALWRDVPRPVRDGDRGGRRDDRQPARGAAAGREPADGRLARGVRADEAACARPLRQMAGDHRRAAAQGPGALLHDDGDAPLRQGRGAMPRAAISRQPKRRHGVSRRRARPFRRADMCSTTPASIFSLLRPR